MCEVLARLVGGFRPTGNLRLDATSFLSYHGLSKTADHCARVAAEAKRLAARYGEEETLAEAAGWLHDISAVIPEHQRVQTAQEVGQEALPEEAAAPMILHQRLSAVIAQEVFDITSEPVLNAVECHSTLKANASTLDKIVFIADKIAWDQSGEPPFLRGILGALEQSLDRAALHYLQHLWQRRDSMPTVRPWFVEAYEQLRSTCSPAAL
jgi:predicted HD superfamily hydrolase involved in NAD metabolism